MNRFAASNHEGPIKAHTKENIVYVAFSKISGLLTLWQKAPTSTEKLYAGVRICASDADHTVESMGFCKQQYACCELLIKPMSYTGNKI